MSFRTRTATADRPPQHLIRASAVRNASMLTLATLTARASMFALGIVLARSLGAADYGRYSLALALGAVLQPIADFGISVYLVRETARDRTAAEGALGRLARVKVGLLVAATALTVGGAAAFGTSPDLLLVVTVMVVAAMLDGWSIFVYCYLQGRESMGVEARTTAVAGIVRACGAIAIALATGDLRLVVAWVLAVAVVQAAVASRTLRRIVGRLASPRGARVDWRSVASFGLIGISVVVYLRSDALLIAWFQDETAVGLYAAAYTLVLGVQVVPVVLTAALFPIFARTHGDGTDGFTQTWHDGLRLLLLITLPVSVLLCVLAGPIIQRAFGSEFAESADVLRIITWMSPLVAVSLAAQAVLKGSRREGTLLRVSLACVVFNVGINLWAIPAAGIKGAAATTVATEAINAVALLWYVVSRGLVPRPDLPLLRVGTAVALLAVVAALLAEAPVELAAAAALAVYVGTLVATGVLRGEELAGLRRLTQAG